MVYASPSYGLTRVDKYKLGARAGKHRLGARAGKYKSGARAGKYKLGARAGKHKLGARAGKYKLGARAGGREIQIPLKSTYEVTNTCCISVSTIKMSLYKSQCIIKDVRELSSLIFLI